MSTPTQMNLPKRFSSLGVPTHPYTIIGYHPSTMQRFATHLQAASPEEAEEHCMAKHPYVAVCGVLAGYQQCMDKAEHVTALAEYAG